MRSHRPLRRSRPAGLALLFAAFAVGAAPAPARAGEVHVAVTTSFATTARAVAAAFERETGHRVLLSEGSTGKLYAQIVHGAPFEVFLAADAERPRRLADAGLADPGFAYALGRLVLWSPDPDRATGPEALAEGRVRRLAIASPELAPYGAAAREVLRGLGRWEALEPCLVRGQDVGQALRFVATGNAEMGFVALAQVLGAGGSRWIVPADLYTPRAQHAVLLAAGRDDPAARAFLAFLRGDAARAIVEAAGFDLPSGGAP